jgi:hypothetical protein
MVNEEKINDKIYYQCDICKFYYNEKKWAEKCQEWCSKNNSCNVEITKHAVNLKEENQKKKGVCC